MDLAKELHLLRCSQNWDLDDLNDIEKSLRDKYSSGLEEYDSDEYASNVKLFHFYYHLSYEVYKKGRYSEALELINKTNVTDKFMERYDRVFKHAAQASKAYILYKMDSVAEASQIVNVLKDQTFSKEEDAGFDYLKSVLYVGYGEERSKHAVDSIESACKIVPEEAEFSYYLGSTLGKIRHYCFPRPEPYLKELNACRKAVTLKKNNLHYSICLARLYMEMRHKVPGHKKREYLTSATSLIKNLLKNHGSLSGNDIARCIFQLLKLRVDPADLEEYAEEALSKADSILCNHYIGDFYIRNGQPDKARECLNKVSTRLPYICGKILLLMYRINGDSLSDDEIDDFVTKLEENYKATTDDNLCEFYLSISEFYLFVINDLNVASKYFLLASELGIDEIKFTTLTKFSVNYFAILKNHIVAYSPKNDLINMALKELNSLPKDLLKDHSWNPENYYSRKQLVI